jgi:hypothetical protein
VSAGTIVAGATCTGPLEGAERANWRPSTEGLYSKTSTIRSGRFLPLAARRRLPLKQIAVSGGAGRPPLI